MSTLLPKPTLCDVLPTESSNLANVEQFTVRALNANDGHAFRAIRLEALRNDGNFLGPLYEEENKLTDDQWRQRCTETNDSCFFGLFDKDRLIGIMSAKKWCKETHDSCFFGLADKDQLLDIMSAKKWDEDKEGRTALWMAAYLKPEYRGRKIAEKLYQARLEWTKRNPNQFKRAVFFIHEENIRSREIHEKQGPKYLFTRSMQWANGPIARWRWYEKEL